MISAKAFSSSSSSSFSPFLEAAALPCFWGVVEGGGRLEVSKQVCLLSHQ